MFRILAAVSCLALSGAAIGACPDYLDHSMRKLHSKEEVNLCAVQAGKPMLVINTASHCGYTPQFKGLESLHRKYGKDGLVVVGFASDDFRQEAKDEEKAAEVCYVNYGVTFTMIAPSHVKGDQANPVFRALAAQSGEPRWNFNKYLVDGSGKVVQHFGSGTTPEDTALNAAIESVL
jgi:glutathione peroxidase